MKKTYPKISIITPSYNQGKFIEKNILSVIDQGYPNIEHIIIDGGSTDSTVGILKKYPHLLWVSEKDTGQSNAFNKGLKMATGEIIGWINSDDYLEKGALFEVADVFEDKKTKWAIGNIVFDYRMTDSRVAGKTPETTYEKLLSGPDIVRQQGGLFRKDFLNSLGGLDESIHFAMDYDLWLRASKKSIPKIVDKDWAAFTIHEDQKTSYKYFLVQSKQIVSIMRNNGSPFILRTMFFCRYSFYMIKHFIKSALIKIGLIEKKYSTVSFFNRQVDAEKLNVAILLDRTDCGGAESLILDLAQTGKISTRGKLILITARSGKLESVFAKKIKNRYRLKRRFPLDIGLILRIRKIIKINKIDIIHAHNPVAGIHAYFARMNLKTKIVLTHHDCNVCDKTKDTIAKYFLLRHASANIFVAKVVFNFFSQKLKVKNPFILYNGVDFEKIDSPPPVDIKKILSLKPKTKIIGSLGNLYTGQKDVLTTCKAINEIIKKGIPVHFVIIGGFNKDSKMYLDSLEYCRANKISGNVHFLGHVNNIGGYLKSFDIFVHSSNFEANPIAVIEAMSQGLPVILNDIPPLQELGEIVKSLVYYKTGDYEMLGKKIMNMLAHQKDATAIGKKNKDDTLKNFSLDMHKERLLEIYKEIL
jgi:glycosyltransferase involved in cell wall biosynthesis